MAASNARKYPSGTRARRFSSVFTGTHSRYALVDGDAGAQDPGTYTQSLMSMTSWVEEMEDVALTPLGNTRLTALGAPVPVVKISRMPKFTPGENLNFPKVGTTATVTYSSGGLWVGVGVLLPLRVWVGVRLGDPAALFVTLGVGVSDPEGVPVALALSLVLEVKLVLGVSLGELVGLAPGVPDTLWVWVTVALPLALSLALLLSLMLSLVLGVSVTLALALALALLLPLALKVGLTLALALSLGVELPLELALVAASPHTYKGAMFNMSPVGEYEYVS